jgi:transposase
MPRSTGPTSRPPGRKKNPDTWPQLGGPPEIQRPEPADHALGRSQGGFGTKTHLVCDSHGIILAVTVTPGQRHESQAVEDTFARAKRPRRAGPQRWPDQAAGDKGYSYAKVRTWLERRHIDPVIPTRKDQPRDPDFDKPTYRRRNIIERAIGWFKWCRALATRYDKLAVNYVALWIVANIQYLLRMYPEALGVRLSETT